jgi:folate-dependent phosphoribosylglycinamide formyltransferase PurN|tara:strand:- start:176 stop:712 length:537 start_codon:yes stop_codon:yes gene_type:complete
MVTRPWIVFFSQTGSEIADLSEALGRWPDRIITNDRPEHLRTIDKRIVDKGFFTFSNKPDLIEYADLLEHFPEAIITLHGWLRVLPAEICNKFSIYNGHPGLITMFPELKGKDPQMKAFNLKHEVMGCVIHKVTAGVDEGKVLKESFFNSWKITEKEMWKVLKDRSCHLWIEFLTPML